MSEIRIGINYQEKEAFSVLELKDGKKDPTFGLSFNLITIINTSSRKIYMKHGTMEKSMTLEFPNKLLKYGSFWVDIASLYTCLYLSEIEVFKSFNTDLTYTKMNFLNLKLSLLLIRCKNSLRHLINNSISFINKEIPYLSEENTLDYSSQSVSIVEYITKNLELFNLENIHLSLQDLSSRLTDIEGRLGRLEGFVYARRGKIEDNTEMKSEANVIPKIEEVREIISGITEDLSDDNLYIDNSLDHSLISQTDLTGIRIRNITEIPLIPVKDICSGKCDESKTIIVKRQNKFKNI